jgi:predicted GNAT family acetyltransferase
MTQSSVRHNEKDERFESDAEGGIAFVEYIIDGDEITFTHTEVPKQAEGKGVAGRLVADAISYARVANLRVIPQCTYVAAWLKRHREYDDILHPEYREG